MRHWLGPLLLTLLVAGCGIGDREDDAADESVDPNAVYGSVAQRCGYGTSGELFSIEGPDGGILTGAVFGEGQGDHAAVLVHQNDEAGKMCGWVPFATYAAKQGVMTVLMDVCGFGETIPCEDSVGDIPDQLQLAVDHARELGASSVSIVGASMGGVIAAALAQQVDADNLVAVSPPGTMVGLSLTSGLSATTIPTLVMGAPSDRLIDLDTLQRAVDGSPASIKSFLSTARPGHGYALLFSGSPDDASITEYGELVLDWILGELRLADPSSTG